MIIIADDNYAQLGVLPSAQDIKRTRDITGTDTLEFNYAMFNVVDSEEVLDEMVATLKPQNHILTADQVYVIKEVNPSDDNILEVECEVDTEDLKSLYNNAFVRTNVLITEIANNALVGSGWTVNTDVTKLRSLAMTNSTALDILKKLAETYMCDLQFDAKNKIVNFLNSMGTSKGTFFNDKLNLVALNIKQDTHDFCTRLIPVGQNDMYITDVNGGLPYVENYQYTDQVITAYWSAGQYTDANALKEDAVAKLAILSQPQVTFDATVLDLARISELNPDFEDFSELSYNIGDTVTIMDSKKEIGQTVRIIQTVEYMDKPEQNTVQFDSMYQLMEDLFEKSLHTAETVDAITTADDGSVSGDAVDSIDWTKVKNVQIQTAQIGDLQVTTEKVADSTITTAKIGDLQVTNEKVSSLSADKLTAGTIDAGVITVTNLNASNISGGTIDAHVIGVTNLDASAITTGTFSADRISGGTIDASLIDVIKLNATNITTGVLDGTLIKAHTIVADQLVAGTITADSGIIATSAIGTAQIADGSITDAKVVDLSANSITAGTLSVDRLIIRGSDESIVYELNNIPGATQTLSQTTINGEALTDRTITADKVVANAITANEIAANTITANEIAANTITASSGVIGSIDAGKITTGTLNGAYITTINLQAQELLVKYNGTSLINARPDINGGRIYVYNNNGTRNVTIGSSGFSANNYGGTLILHNNSDAHRVEAGIASQYDAGLINLLDSNGVTRAGLYASNKGNGPALGLLSSFGATMSYIDSDNLIVGGNYIVRDDEFSARVGENPAYVTSVSISSGSNYFLYHYLGYYPIVVLSGTVGNVIVTYHHESSNELRLYCYSSGGSTWNGTVYLY